MARRVAMALAAATAGLLLTDFGAAAGATAPGPSRSTPSGPVAVQAPASTAPAVPVWARRLPDDTNQVIRTVSSSFWCRQVYCTVTQAWHKSHGVWTVVKHFRSTIGRAGWGKRREGDMRSPNGVYTIKVTFSTRRHPTGRMPWKQRKPTSAVSDAHGRLYNTWIEQRGRTDGNRPSMRYGFVVNYNHVRLRAGVGPRPVQGKGSGIFYHTSKPGHPWAPTEGCTQIGSVTNARWLVRWLRPGAHPRVVQNL